MNRRWSVGAVRRWVGFVVVALLVTTVGRQVRAMSAGEVATRDSSPDVMILMSGDQLVGTFIRAVSGTVTFHSTTLGDVQIGWSKIKELRTSVKVSVIRKGVVIDRATPSSEIPVGLLRMSDQQLVLEGDDHSPVATIPIANVEYVVDQVTLDKELRGEPGLLQAWNGGLTAGATLVEATQNSYNLDGSLSLVRTVPTVSWLETRNRTTLLLSGSAGKITQPAYISTTGDAVPEQVTKTDIYHASLQRDQYFSSSVYYFGIVQYDHNFSQSLQLQQLYGAGLGWTAVHTPKQTLDVTANIQYVKETFIDAQPGDNKNLVGSTLSANYVAQVTPEIAFTQYAAYLPAFNSGKSYSLVERNSLTLPAYKGFRFVLGTNNSYLNAVASGDPPAKRNSFQFTFGVSYDITSSY